MVSSLQTNFHKCSFPQLYIPAVNHHPLFFFKTFVTLTSISLLLYKTDLEIHKHAHSFWKWQGEKPPTFQTKHLIFFSEVAITQVVKKEVMVFSNTKKMRTVRFPIFQTKVGSRKGKGIKTQRKIVLKARKWLCLFINHFCCYNKCSGNTFWAEQ